MTVAISCNLSEGVVFGVDSAATVPAPGGGVAKVFENAEKLFQLGNKPVGIATYGIAGFERRGIGSFIREFELINPKGVISESTELIRIVEQLRIFFLDVYRRSIVPAIEEETKDKFDKIPKEKIPIFGLVVGGFSKGAYLSEVWNITIPINDQENSGINSRGQGSFGTDWFATFEPIRRYIKGYDPRLIDEVLKLTQSMKGSEYSEEEFNQIRETLKRHEYVIPFDAMPLEEGIAHTKFLVELAINHHRYAIGAPIVGGNVNLGKVTYKMENFELLANDNLERMLIK